MAYEHLVKKNEIYRQGPVHKCGCGYVAETLSGLERHRRSGFTKYDGSRGAFSYNRMICCCYCNNGVPYTVPLFTRHMISVHCVKPRVISPVLNQCPFCSYGGQGCAVASHIIRCRSLFKPNLNLFYPSCIYDLPLLRSQPSVKFPPYQPRNVMHAQNVLRTAVSILPHTASSSVVIAPVTSHRPIAPMTSHRPVSTTLAPAVSVATWHVVGGGTQFSPAGVNLLPRQTSLGNPVRGISNGIRRFSVPTAVSVVPVGIYTNRFTAPFRNLMPTPCVLPVQTRNIYSSGVYPDSALNFCRSASGLPSQQLLSPSAQQQIANAVSQVFCTSVAKNNVPSTTRHDVVASSSSLGALRVQTEDPQMKIKSGISKKGCHKKVDKGSVKMAPRCHSESAPTSSVSRVLSKNADRRVSSGQLPVVVLHRLTVSVCEVCGSMFEKLLFLRHHLLNAHGISVTESDCLPGSLRRTKRCVSCSLRFFSRKGLNRHMQIVHELRSCPRCSETGISDLIKHLHEKHSLTARTMVDYRVCYLCKLNFTSAAAVEIHAISTHADIFPSSSHFRQAVRASVCGSTSTNTQAEGNPSVTSQKHRVGFSGHPEPVVGVVRKRPHSVIEIDLDSSDSVKEQSANQTCKEQSSNVVGLKSSETGTSPVRKKARKSGRVSADAIYCKTPAVNTDQSEALSARDRVCEEHSASQATKNMPDMSVRLTALKSVHKTDSSVLSRTEKTTNSSVNVSDKLASMPGVSVRLTALNSVHKTDSSVLSPTDKRTNSSVNVSDKTGGIPDMSVRLTALKSVNKTDSSVLSPTDKRTGSSVNISDKLASMTGVSVRLTALNSVHKTDSAVLPPTDKRTGSSVNAGNKTDGSVHFTALTEFAVVAKESTRTSDNTSCKSTGLPEVSVDIPPLSSSRSEDTSAKKDKGQYRFV